METTKETFKVQRIYSTEKKYIIIGCNRARFDLPKADCLSKIPPKLYFFKKHEVTVEYLAYSPVVMRMEMDGVTIFREKQTDFSDEEKQETARALNEYDDTTDVLEFNTPNMQSFFREREEIYLTAMKHVPQLIPRVKIEEDIISAAGAMLHEKGGFGLPSYREAIHFLVAYADLPMNGNFFVRSCILQMIDFARAYVADCQNRATYETSEVLRLPSFIMPENLTDEIIESYFCGRK